MDDATGRSAGVDTTEMRERYRRERDKRLQADRREVPELVGDLAHYLDDPFSSPVQRVPVADEVDVIVVGAGLAGLQIGGQLRRRGVERVRLIDTAGDVGGVWYWNRYPGAMCDVESLVYMPMLEELGYTPSMRYAPATEIQAHCQAIAKHFGLYDRALLQTSVRGARWDVDASLWRVTTDRGDDLAARFLVLAQGPLSRPKLPAIPGIETFRGRAFHTSRWDYGYTGGGPDEEMDRLGDQRVGVVGTGATGLQCVPALARAAGQVYVFQRTPSTVAPRDNAPIEPGWVADQEPGWQARRRRNFTDVLAGEAVDMDLVADGWTELYRSTVADPAYRSVSPERAAELMAEADMARMDFIRGRIEGIVRDPAAAEALKPYYDYFCKRPGFHDDYLEAFNQPNMRLIDTDGRGLERVTERGVVVGGEEYELDALVFATGFEVETAYTHRVGFDVVGRDQLLLSEKWSPALATFQGLMTAGFPNLFVMPGLNTQSVVTTNVVDSQTENAEQVAYVIEQVRARGARTFDVVPAAESAWVRLIVERARDRAEFLAACTPGRNNNEGRVDLRPPENANWGGRPSEFFRLLGDWRAADSLEGLVLGS